MKKKLSRNLGLYIMLILPILFFIVFRYVPMSNIVVAFKDYNLILGTWKSPWAGFKYFKQAFGDNSFWNALKNTFVLNGLDLVIGFPVPIILAILLNELVSVRYKRIVQTVLYMPHFLSWIIISGIAFQIFAPSTGLLNQFITSFGGKPIPFLTDAAHWVGTYVGLGLWQSMGWNTIIYLAAITSIDPTLYEAAEIDGAGRFAKMRNITLPSISPTIITMLIMNLGRILSTEFDRPWSLRNTRLQDVADVLSTYVYRLGIRDNRIALATAVGLFQSVVCVIFLVIANQVAKKFGEDGIW
ncbi:protein lplB [Clostridia bacterium]|nr:protein lplB [Clostridia bacterium]